MLLTRTRGDVNVPPVQEYVSPLLDTFGEASEGKSPAPIAALELPNCIAPCRRGLAENADAFCTTAPWVDGRVRLRDPRALLGPRSKSISMAEGPAPAPRTSPPPNNDVVAAGFC